MRIFLTGATGYIGGAVLDALVRGAHDVTALVRDNQKAALVAARGGHPVVGNLADSESFRVAAESQDGYIHVARDSASSVWATTERTAIEAIVTAARRPRTAAGKAGTTRFIIYTSGTWVLGSAPQPVSEDSPLNPVALVSWRPEHEQRILAAADANLRAMVVRPGVVYGGGSGMVGDLLRSASNGLVRVVGDGNNHWPLVYDRDLADLYLRLANGEATAGVYHANDEGDERVNDIVAAIAPYLPVRPDVRHVPIEEARHQMGAYADALALDQVIRSPRARALGWTPTLHSVAGNAARLLEEWRASR
jgi:nucleoside-diphosphate-sugar epimerase